MVTRRGTLLEKNIEKIFNLAGFNTQRGVFISGYEVDVFAKLKKHTVAIQCKQYESASLNIRDLIHEWDSKNKFIRADRVVIMVFGQEVKKEHRDLAKRLGIVIWDEKNMEYVEDKVINERDNAQEELLKIIDMKLDVEIKSKKRSVGWIIFWVLLILFGVMFVLGVVSSP
jgi:Holliday junction resolvase